MRCIKTLALWLVLAGYALAADVLVADISNPLKLLAVGDRSDNIIDVIDLDKGKVVHRFNTAFHPDHLVISPYAPILMYTNIEKRVAVFYDLRTQSEIKRLVLPVTPRHVVLDTTGGLVGISDSEDGGFVLLSMYGQSVLFSLPDFPPTTDVLFDPNEVDIYYSNSATGSIGLLDTSVRKWIEMPLTQEPGQQLFSPSRSLDARYIYVANGTTGEVYNLNAFSKVVYKTFRIGASPARPYTTPQGSFLYLLDRESGHFVSIEQGSFREYANTTFKKGVDLVTVGRFDRFNLFLSTQHDAYYVYDNVHKAVVAEGNFTGRPIAALGAADGRTAYIAFSDTPQLAMLNLEEQALRYFAATNNGAGAFAMGLSNNICH